MSEVRWSRPVERASFRLSSRSRAEPLHVSRLLRDNLEMFRMVESGNWRGYRAAPLAPHWILYYRVSGPERNCLLAAIVDVRRRPV